MRSLTLLGLLLACSSVAAALTVTVDQEVYVVGQTVTITYDNTGGEAIEFRSIPPFTIHRLDGDYEFILGLPGIVVLPAGETMVETWDTGMLPDPAGQYRVVVSGWLQADPDETVSAAADYTLEEPVAAQASTWSAVHRLFR